MMFHHFQGYMMRNDWVTTVNDKGEGSWRN